MVNKDQHELIGCAYTCDSHEFIASALCLAKNVKYLNIRLCCSYDVRAESNQVYHSLVCHRSLQIASFCLDRELMIIAVGVLALEDSQIPPFSLRIPSLNPAPPSSTATPPLHVTTLYPC
ncbi:hypothetical protein GOODEAATRI_010516 [Goodea atripinnis]|uniref:Uncharacterized protein n=1 Tax=Goodea atripinnis TaxID=208336 RepID=A0ABV0MGQ8_9TELE